MDPERKQCPLSPLPFQKRTSLKPLSNSPLVQSLVPAYYPPDKAAAASLSTPQPHVSLVNPPPIQSPSPRAPSQPLTTEKLQCSSDSDTRSNQARVGCYTYHHLAPFFSLSFHNYAGHNVTTSKQAHPPSSIGTPGSACSTCSVHSPWRASTWS